MIGQAFLDWAQDDQAVRAWQHEHNLARLLGPRPPAGKKWRNDSAGVMVRIRNAFPDEVLTIYLVASPQRVLNLSGRWLRVLGSLFRLSSQNNGCCSKELKKVPTWMGSNVGTGSAPQWGRRSTGESVNYFV